MKLARSPHRPDILILHADATLNTEAAMEAVDHMERMLDSGARHVIVDCSEVRDISSFGLGVLIRIHHRLRKRGGDLRIAGVGPLLSDAIEMTRLDRIFEIHPNLPAAIAAVSSL